GPHRGAAFPPALQPVLAVGDRRGVVVGGVEGRAVHAAIDCRRRSRIAGPCCHLCPSACRVGSFCSRSPAGAKTRISTGEPCRRDPPWRQSQKRKFTPPRTSSSLNLTSVLVPNPQAAPQLKVPRSTCRYSTLALRLPTIANSTPAPAVQP